MCLLFILFLIFFFFTTIFSSIIELNINSKKITINENQVQNLTFIIKDDLINQENYKIEFSEYDKNVIKLTNVFDELNKKEFKLNGTIRIEGKSVGYTYLILKYCLYNKTTESLKVCNFSKKLEIVVSLNENVKLSKLFFIFVAILVSLNTINMGCAVEIPVIINTFKKPTAPIIGFFTHYFFMPLFSYIVGKFVFVNQPWLRLSLFIFGCSPTGSAANMWTVLLDGNLNLTITMTFLSNLFAIFMMPLWIFTLGKQIFDQALLEIPYRNIFFSLITIVICIGIGLLIQKKSSKLTSIAKRILAPVSGILIILIVLLAIYCYWYLLKLLTWKIILASTLNVWSGFLIGIVFGILFKQKLEDIISISIETGIQNTGITYILIKFSLDSPYRDFALAVPIAASIMTSLPLTLAYLFIKLKKKTINFEKVDFN